MPATAAHCLLAHRILAEWAVRGDCPFPARDAVCVNAFLNGGLGPDMGLFSAPDALISDLAHYVRSADLCRTLLRHAEDGVQRAYAWGWASHVLADVQIHPLINRGVGELLTGDRSREIPFADDPVAHIRVEMGLDVICFNQLESGRQSTFTVALDEHSIEFVDRAFAETYGEHVVRRAALLRAHRACARYSRWIRCLNQVHSARQRGGRIPVWLWPFYFGVYRPTKWRVRWRPDTVAYAACNPINLPDWLSRQCEGELAAVPGRCLSLVDSQWAEIPNYNLDLGKVEQDATPYSLTQQTLAELDRRRTAAQSQHAVAGLP